MLHAVAIYGIHNIFWQILSGILFILASSVILAFTVYIPILFFVSFILFSFNLTKKRRAKLKFPFFLVSTSFLIYFYINKDFYFLGTLNTILENSSNPIYGSIRFYLDPIPFYSVETAYKF